MSAHFLSLSDQILNREIDRLRRLLFEHYVLPLPVEYYRALQNIIVELINEAMEVLHYDTSKLDAQGYEAYCIYKCEIINEILFYK